MGLLDPDNLETEDVVALAETVARCAPIVEAGQFYCDQYGCAACVPIIDNFELDILDRYTDELHTFILLFALLHLRGVQACLHISVHINESVGWRVSIRRVISTQVTNPRSFRSDRNHQ